MRMAPPELPGKHAKSDSPLDRALALLLANEDEAALRWSAAAVERDPAQPSALILTCRLLSTLGRSEAAAEGFRVAVARAIDAGNLPLAVAGVGDLRAMGVDVNAHLDAIAAAFCADSPRLGHEAPPPPPIPAFDDFQPLSSFLSGPALLSKATDIVHRARHAFDDGKSSEPLPIAPLPLFSALEKDGLRALIAAFEMVTVPADHTVIAEGEEGAEAYIVARGELEVRKAPADGSEEPFILARLTNGALFGEMALLSRAPRAASVVACRPSILLTASRDALEAVAAKRPDVGGELAAHCRRRMVANLGRTSNVLAAVDAHERPALVERFETRVFEKGEKLIAQGDDPNGLHIIASGEVAVLGRDGGDTIVIATLGAGDTVGEVALVLRRKGAADVVAVHPTVTLFLPKAEFLTLVRDHPAILHPLYVLAVQRDAENSMVLESAPTSVADDYVLL